MDHPALGSKATPMLLFVFSSVRRQSSPLIKTKFSRSIHILGLLSQVFSDSLGRGYSYEGLTADARILAKWLRLESLNYKYVYEGQQPLGRLAQKLADKSQVSYFFY